MKALFVSPHLDDAVFSAGGMMARLVDEGSEVALATVFTRSVPSPNRFALSCQTDKGIAADVDYMALRREEDRLACARLGVRPLWLDLPEAPHRGYESKSELFGPRHEEDAVEPVIEAVSVLAENADIVAGPLALGGHVDHHLVVDALEALELDAPRIAWEDMPYALRVEPASRGQLPTVTLSGDHIVAKLNACAAYASQLAFQFGGETDMRRQLAAEAESHGCGERACIVSGPIEGLLASLFQAPRSV